MIMQLAITQNIIDYQGFILVQQGPKKYTNADFLEWEERIKKILCYLSQKKLHIQKHLQNLNWARNFVVLGILKILKCQYFNITFLLKFNGFLNNYILASLEIYFSLILYQTRIHWKSINGAIHQKTSAHPPTMVKFANLWSLPLSSEVSSLLTLNCWTKANLLIIVASEPLCHTSIII